jgi:hypothetical protein
MSRLLGWRIARWSLCLVVFGAGLRAQLAPVEVSRVTFGEVIPRGESRSWWEAAIELRGRSREVEARREPLVVGLELAFQRRDERFVFFRSRAALLVPEANDQAVVRFYLPPGVLERDGLRPRPFAWRVWLAQGERAYPQGPGSYSDALASPEAARSFVQRLEGEAEANDGWLQPIYLTPFFQAENGRLDDSPAYLRREAAVTAR